MTAPLIAFSIPLLDTALAVIRRLLRGQPICGADRRHIHHLLLDRGLTPRRVALLPLRRLRRRRRFRAHSQRGSAPVFGPGHRHLLRERLDRHTALG